MLGFADPERLAAMRRVLRLAAENLQVLILTADPTRYDELGPHHVHRMTGRG